MVILYATPESLSQERRMTLETELAPLCEQHVCYILCSGESDNAREVRPNMVLVHTRDPEHWLRYICEHNHPGVIRSPDPQWVFRGVGGAIPILDSSQSLFHFLEASFPTMIPLRVLLVSSWNVRCGIAEYTKYLSASLSQLVLAADVLDFRSTDDYIGPICSSQYDVVHFQYDPSFVQSEIDFVLQLRTLRVHAPKLGVVITPHHFDLGVYRSFGDIVDLFIVHKGENEQLPKVVSLVQGCPVFPEVPKIVARQEFGIPEDAHVVASFGFMLPWKRIPETVTAFFSYLQTDSKCYLQLLHSIHESESDYGAACELEMWRLIRERNLESQVYFTTQFLPIDVVNRRLQASDVGILCGNISTGSSSASAKAYVSARVPIVASDINHYRDLSSGVVWVNPDPTSFVASVVSILQDVSQLNRLREEQRQNYQEINYDTVAQRHVDLYQQVVTTVRKGRH